MILSELYMMDKNFKTFLGGVKMDDRNRIISAKATKMSWMGKINSTK